MVLNINLPGVPPDEVKGIRVTKLGSRHFTESLTTMKDPWGREVFWIGGGVDHLDRPAPIPTTRR